MTSPNLTTVHRIYESFATRDLAAILGAMHPDVVVRQDAPLPWGGTYTGPAGVRAFLGALLSHVDPRLDTGDAIVQVGRTRGLAHGNGKKFDATEIHVWRFSDGLVSSYQVYIDVPQMVAALS